MTHRLVFVCFLGALAIALGLHALSYIGPASADPVVDAGTAPSIQLPSPEARVPQLSPTAPEQTVEDVQQLWRNGAYLAAGIVALFLLLTALLKADPKRALWWTSGLAALAGLVELIARGVTPNLAMLVGAAAVFVALVTRSPLAPKQPDPPRGPSLGPPTTLAVLALVLGSCVATSCSSAHREVSRDVAADVVDCTIGVGKAHADEYGTLLEAVLRAATSPDGTVDWSAVKRVAIGFGAETGACAIATVVARMLAAPARSSSVLPAAAPLLDQDARVGWEHLARELWGGRRYRVAGGAVL